MGIYMICICMYVLYIKSSTSLFWWGALYMNTTNYISCYCNTQQIWPHIANIGHTGLIPHNHIDSTLLHIWDKTQPIASSNSNHIDTYVLKTNMVAKLHICTIYAKYLTYIWEMYVHIYIYIYIYIYMKSLASITFLGGTAHIQHRQ